MRLKAQSLKIKEQEQKIQEQTTKIQEQEATLTDIKKHIDEWDQKYKDLTTELVKARDDILSATVHKPESATSPSASTKFYKSNIKPRVTHILPKNYIGIFDLERKRKSNLLPEIPVKRNKSPEVGENPTENRVFKASTLAPFKDSKTKTEDSSINISSKLSRSDIGSIISSSLETLLKNPIMNIKSRKRKIIEEIDLK